MAQLIDYNKNETPDSEPLNIKSLVVKNALFEYYRSGFVYYSIQTGDGINWIFPIPLDDVGNATLSWQEKGITLMRWIRKAIDNNEIHKMQQPKVIVERNTPNPNDNP